MATPTLTKEQTNVVLAVTFGNILEWFDLYSYIYLSNVLAKLFFNFTSSTLNLLSIFTIFGIGFLARPLGALIFGRIGDLVGRKSSFILSIFILILPTTLLGFLPTYEQVGIIAPIILVTLRLVQSIPSAGETPGTICFLYEYAAPHNQKFMTSWTAVGNQLGAILAILEGLLLDKYLPDDMLLTWGWRISFWSGGLIGLFGLYLRSKLHETPSFRHLKNEHHLDHETTLNVIKNHKKPILLGVAYGAINASTYYITAIYVPLYFGELLGLSEEVNTLISLGILTFTTLLIPIFGALGDTYNNRRLLIYSALLTIALLFPLYISLMQKHATLLAITCLTSLLPLTCITALLAYRYAVLFSTSIRYTGIAFSFNIADGIIGGFTPAIALLLFSLTSNKATLCWFILLCSCISLISFVKIKEKSSLR